MEESTDELQHLTKWATAGAGSRWSRWLQPPPAHCYAMHGSKHPRMLLLLGRRFHALNPHDTSTASSVDLAASSWGKKAASLQPNQRVLRSKGPSAQPRIVPNTCEEVKHAQLTTLLCLASAQVGQATLDHCLRNLAYL